MKNELYDDPRLTALVLGELDDQERAALEAELANDPAAQAYLDELRETTNLLEAELGKEPVTGLSDEQRASVLSRGGVPPKRRFRLLMFVIPAAAACVALAIGLVALFNPGAYAPGTEATSQRVSESSDDAFEPLGEFNYGRDGKVWAAPSSGAEGTVDGAETVVAGDQGAARNEWTNAQFINGQVEGGKPGTQKFPEDAAGASAPAEPAPAATPAQQYSATERMAKAEDLERRTDTRQRQLAQAREQPAAAAPQRNAPVVAARPAEESRTMASAAAPHPLTSPSAPLAEAEAQTFGFSAPRDATPEVRAPSANWNRESYQQIVENEYKQVKDHPLSTFSINVDTAAYANVRRMLNQNRMPPKDAVRIEELVNYFDYDYPQPEGDTPFSVSLEVAQAPWQMQHRLVRIGLKGKEVQTRPEANLVFLIDVSGSMNRPNKLPLVRESLKLLVGQLKRSDRVAIVVYAGASGLVLPPTPGNDIDTIIGSLNKLQAGGSTNGGAGIQLAYNTARDSFIKGGINRVILATDGDFNVGTTNRGDLVRMVEEYAKENIFLTVLGFGMGNLNDHTLEQLASKGNGNYGYIDTLAEARKMMVEQVNGTLVTIAKDVKIQVEFNPAQVQAYRLIGYENRMLAKEDFNDDTKDAGEIGAGHTVTALYEVIPVGVATQQVAKVDELRYAARSTMDADVAEADDVAVVPGAVAVPQPVANELLNVKLRYKAPVGDTSTKVEFPLVDEERRFTQASADFKFAASVAAFGMILRDSANKGSASYDQVLELAQESIGDDPHGYRKEFLDLVRKAKALDRR